MVKGGMDYLNHDFSPTEIQAYAKIWVNLAKLVPKMPITYSQLSPSRIAISSVTLPRGQTVETYQDMLFELWSASESPPRNIGYSLSASKPVEDLFFWFKEEELYEQIRNDVFLADGQPAILLGGSEKELDLETPDRLMMVRNTEKGKVLVPLLMTDNPLTAQEKGIEVEPNTWRILPAMVVLKDLTYKGPKDSPVDQGGFWLLRKMDQAAGYLLGTLDYEHRRAPNEIDLTDAVRKLQEREGVTKG